MLPDVIREQHRSLGVDERLVRMLDDDLVLTLADGGRYILLELPHDIFIDISINHSLVLTRHGRSSAGMVLEDTPRVQAG